MLSDTTIPAPNSPAITYGTRGRLNVELTVHGPSHDLHSGTFGGAIHNPLQALCEIVAKLHDSDQRVAIPGFYDRVAEPSPAERARLARSGPSGAQLLKNAGVNLGWGEAGYLLFERTSIRPALTVNGLTGGYQGPGKKDVIPSTARARIAFRLVPGQDPQEIDRLFRHHIVRITPPTVRSTVRTISSAMPSLLNPKHRVLRAAKLAYRKGFGVSPVLLRSGGTISIVHRLRQTFAVPAALMGYGLPDDRQHAPNEKFHLPNFYNGITTSIWFLSALAAGAGSDDERPQHHARERTAGSYV
jgi:acetylornithine deacetylase/succinyl-diaminopimelate desuccinylase-like protein